jgi:hypothetical protein
MQPCYSEPPLLRRAPGPRHIASAGSRSPLSASWTISLATVVTSGSLRSTNWSLSAPPHQACYLIRSKCAGIVVFKGIGTSSPTRAARIPKGVIFLHVPCVRFATETTVQPPTINTGPQLPPSGGAPRSVYRGFHGYPINACFDMVAPNRSGPAHALHDFQSDFRGPCNIQPRHGSRSSSKSDGNDQRRRARCLHY